MANSCSSQNNGCEACAPSLSFFGLEASTSLNKIGYSCLTNDGSGGCKVFSSSNMRAKAQASETATWEGCNDSGSNSCSDWSYSRSRSFYIYNVDEYGNLETDIESQSEGDSSCSCGGCISVICLNDEDCTCSQSPESTVVSTCTENSTDSSNTVNQICTGKCCPLVDPGCSGPDLDSTLDQTFISSDSTTLSGEKSLSFFYGLARSSANKKYTILRSNGAQNANGDKCGNGGQDDCWGGGGCFGISDNNLDVSPEPCGTTAQKIAFKIATLKEGFDKKYKSVSGKVKFYYGGTEGKTPCCNDDFDGTVVKETGFSISASSSTFKDDYLASDAGDIDNSDQSHVGETICPCYTIDNASFL